MMESIAVPKLVAILLPLILTVTHALVIALGHWSGRAVQRKKNAYVLDKSRQESMQSEVALRELQHAHNSFAHNAQTQLKTVSEKLKASEDLRDQHARRTAALETENKNLHTILDKAADTRRAVKQRGRPAADK